MTLPIRNNSDDILASWWNDIKTELEGNTNTTSNDFAIGDGADTDKTITAENGDANKPKLKYDAGDSRWQFSNDGAVFSNLTPDTGTGSDDFAIGDGTDTNKTVTAANGDANEPKLQYSAAGSAWQFSNDGTTFENISSGAGNVTVSTKSTSYTILDDDGIRTILIDDTSSARTITLPTASANTNRIITIKNTSSNKGTLLVDGEGAETIDLIDSIYLSYKYDFLTVQCDGISWSIIGQKRSVFTRVSTITGGQVMATPGTHQITFNNIVHDRNSQWSSHKVTVKEDGRYKIQPVIQTLPNANGNATLLLYKNGAPSLSDSSYSTTGLNIRNSFTPAFILDLVKNDYLELYLDHSASITVSASNTVTGGSSFNVMKTF